MKTIALKDKTFQLIKDLKDKDKISSFDKLVLSLILKRENIKQDMFGSLKGKTKGFSRKEREEIMGEDKRWQ